MERNSFLSATALGIAATLAGVGGEAALAAPRQGASNENLRDVYGYLAELGDELGFDDRDYAGHRVAAIAAINSAKSDLLQALQYRHSVLRRQGGSDTTLREEYRRLTRAIAKLGHDDSDYGGHKEAAMDSLQKAKSELDQALLVH